jgi:hypothetical protein
MVLTTIDEQFENSYCRTMNMIWHCSS